MAYGAQVSGLRILDGTVTDLLEGRSFIYKAHINWIYSCSWGPEDNGMSVEGPGYIAKVSKKKGIIIIIMDVIFEDSYKNCSQRKIMCHL